MYWQEEEEQELSVPTRIVDLVFQMESRRLPVDHGYTLYRAVVDRLPWLDEEVEAGIQHIFPADSGNGWTGPEEAGEAYFYPSRRTRFVLRLPAARIDEARVLCGQELAVDDCNLTLKQASERPLSREVNLYARYVAGPADEETFLREVVRELETRDIRARKLVCGKGASITTPEGEIAARSVLLADLRLEESFRLQESGAGPYRKLGCGIFLPHKSVKK
ncbi:type I-MYXAN CRISPR-associated protein Cas6/Cmx6 [Endothiovibrio diazotrophicus]